MSWWSNWHQKDCSNSYNTVATEVGTPVLRRLSRAMFLLVTFEPSSDIARGGCKVNFMGAVSAVSVNRGHFALKKPLWSASFVRCPDREASVSR